MISALSLFLVTTPALAVKPSPVSTCDPAASWKNHGQYVSCVAKLHQGGVVVSTAAKAETGKKSEVTPVPSVSPSTSASPSSSTSASPSVLPSPAGTTLDALNASRAEIEVKALIEVLKSIILSLQNLMTN